MVHSSKTVNKITGRNVDAPAKEDLCVSLTDMVGLDSAKERSAVAGLTTGNFG